MWWIHKELSVDRNQINTHLAQGDVHITIPVVEKYAQWTTEERQRMLAELKVMSEKPGVTESFKKAAIQLLTAETTYTANYEKIAPGQKLFYIREVLDGGDISKQLHLFVFIAGPVKFVSQQIAEPTADNSGLTVSVSGHYYYYNPQLAGQVAVPMTDIKLDLASLRDVDLGNFENSVYALIRMKTFDVQRCMDKKMKLYTKEELKARVFRTYPRLLIREGKTVLETDNFCLVVHQGLTAEMTKEQLGMYRKKLQSLVGPQMKLDGHIKTINLDPKEKKLKFPFQYPNHPHRVVSLVTIDSPWLVPLSENRTDRVRLSSPETDNFNLYLDVDPNYARSGYMRIWMGRVSLIADDDAYYLTDPMLASDYLRLLPSFTELLRLAIMQNLSEKKYLEAATAIIGLVCISSAPMDIKEFLCVHMLSVIKKERRSPSFVASEESESVNAPRPQNYSILKALKHCLPKNGILLSIEKSVLGAYVSELAAELVHVPTSNLGLQLLELYDWCPPYVSDYMFRLLIYNETTKSSVDSLTVRPPISFKRASTKELELMRNATIEILRQELHFAVPFEKVIPAINVNGKATENGSGLSVGAGPWTPPTMDEVRKRLDEQIAREGIKPPPAVAAPKLVPRVVLAPPPAAVKKELVIPEGIQGLLEAQQQLQYLEKQLNEKTDIAERQRLVIAKHDQDIATLKQKRDELERAKQELNVRKTQLESQLQQTVPKTKFDEVQSEITTLKIALAAEKTMKDAVNQKKIELEKEIASLKAQIAAKPEIKGVSIEEQKLQKELDEAKKLNKKLQDDVIRLVSQLQEALPEVGQEEKAKMLQTELKSAKDQIEVQKQKILDLEKQVAEKQGLIEELGAHLLELELAQKKEMPIPPEPGKVPAPPSPQKVPEGPPSPAAPKVPVTPGPPAYPPPSPILFPPPSGPKMPGLPPVSPAIPEIDSKLSGERVAPKPWTTLKATDDQNNLVKQLVVFDITKTPPKYDTGENTILAPIKESIEKNSYDLVDDYMVSRAYAIYLNEGKVLNSGEFYEELLSKFYQLLTRERKLPTTTQWLTEFLQRLPEDQAQYLPLITGAAVIFVYLRFVDAGIKSVDAIYDELNKLNDGWVGERLLKTTGLILKTKQLRVPRTLRTEVEEQKFVANWSKKSQPELKKDFELTDFEIFKERLMMLYAWVDTKFAKVPKVIPPILVPSPVPVPPPPVVPPPIVAKPGKPPSTETISLVSEETEKAKKKEEEEQEQKKKQEQERIKREQELMKKREEEEKLKKEKEREEERKKAEEAAKQKAGEELVKKQEEEKKLPASKLGLNLPSAPTDGRWDNVYYSDFESTATFEGKKTLLSQFITLYQRFQDPSYSDVENNIYGKVHVVYHALALNKTSFLTTAGYSDDNDIKLIEVLYYAMLVSKGFGGEVVKRYQEAIGGMNEQEKEFVDFIQASMIQVLFYLLDKKPIGTSTNVQEKMKSLITTKLKGEENKELRDWIFANLLPRKYEKKKYTYEGLRGIAKITLEDFKKYIIPLAVAIDQ